jgi:hypothetical protein
MNPTQIGEQAHELINMSAVMLRVHEQFYWQVKGQVYRQVYGQVRVQVKGQVSWQVYNHIKPNL